VTPAAADLGARPARRLDSSAAQQRAWLALLERPAPEAQELDKLEPLSPGVRSAITGPATRG